MPSVTDMVQDHLGANGVAQLTEHLGVDPATAQAAAAAALPMLVNAMSSRMSQPGAAPTPAGGVGGLAGAAGGLLGSLFGGNHSEMSQQVANHSGLDIHQAEKVLLFLAPIVMARLAQNRQGAGATAPAAAPTAGSATAGGAAPAGTPEAPAQGQQGGLGAVIDAVERIFHKGS
ncbi:MAG: DUF937 domain-containing protein [Gemmatimonadales bacterium]